MAAYTPVTFVRHTTAGMATRSAAAFPVRYRADSEYYEGPHDAFYVDRFEFDAAIHEVASLAPLFEAA